jgi:hypothetical protein
MWAGYHEQAADGTKMGVVGAINSLNPLYAIAKGGLETYLAVERGDFEAAGEKGVVTAIVTAVTVVGVIQGLSSLSGKPPPGVGPKGAVAETEVTGLQEGSFSIIDWNGYPANIPKPQGPFRLLKGAEYDAARRAADQANRVLHQQNPALNGQQIHEIHPVKFGGSPVDPGNKIPLPLKDHIPATRWWNQLQRDIQ